MGARSRIPSKVEVVVIGAGFAGASTAAALARAGVTPGLIFEREPLPGTHASGRNAAIARQLEAHPQLMRLAVQGSRLLGMKKVDGRPVLSRTGGVYLLHGDSGRSAVMLHQLRAQGVQADLLQAGDARRRFPLLARFGFDYAIFCPTDGVVDIHALLSGLLAEARGGGFEMITNCGVESLIIEGTAVRGVRTRRGEVRTHIVVDATLGYILLYTNP